MMMKNDMLYVSVSQRRCRRRGAREPLTRQRMAVASLLSSRSVRLSACRADLSSSDSSALLPGGLYETDSTTAARNSAGKDLKQNGGCG